MTIKKKVGQLIKKHNTNDPFEISKALGIEVVYEYLGDSLGYFSRFNRTSIIHINDSISHEKQVFTCAHELGHAVLHPDHNTSFLKSHTYYSTSKLESEANEFALQLMLSKEVICPITIHEAVENYGIPEQLLIKKFYA